MNKADALWLELLRAHRGDQFGASACGEYECDAAASASVAARRRNKIRQDSTSFSACNAAAVVGTLATRGCCEIWRIRDDQVEARGLDTCDFFLPEVGTNRVHRL